MTPRDWNSAIEGGLICVGLCVGGTLLILGVFFAAHYFNLI